MFKFEHRDTEAQSLYFIEKTKLTKNEKIFLCVSVSLCSIKINYLTLWCTLITEAKVREPDGKKVVRSWYV